jgi:ankyrin repeat protein
MVVIPFEQLKFIKLILKSQSSMKFNLSVIAMLLQVFCFGQNVFDVAREGDVMLLQEMVKENPELVNAQNEQGYTPLILAAYNGQLEMVKALIKNGADLDQSFTQGAAIHGAAFKGHMEIVKLLVESGAKLDVPDKNQTTPLMYATLFKHTEVAKYLYENGADPLHQDITGNSALNYAESLNNTELLTLFKS